MSPNKVYDGYYKMFTETQPDGYTVSWASRQNPPFKETLRHDCVTIIPVRRSDWTVPVIRQYRPAIGGYCYEFPAGKIDAGETPLEAAKRELLEETGLILDNDPNNVVIQHMIFPSAGMIDECHAIVRGFCDGEVNTNHLCEHEDISIKMLTEEECFNLLDKVLDDGSYMSLGLSLYITGIEHAHMNRFDKGSVV